MKYCLFDGGDVVGPFSAQELLQRPGFGAHSLVCPEEHSNDGSYWKEAHFYAEFALPAPEMFSVPENTDSFQSAQFLKEMDSVITELSSVNVTEKEASARPVVPAKKIILKAKKTIQKVVRTERPFEEKMTRVPVPPAAPDCEASDVQAPHSAYGTVAEPPLSGAVSPDISYTSEESQSLDAERPESAIDRPEEKPRISSVLLRASAEVKSLSTNEESLSTEKAVPVNALPLQPHASSVSEVVSSENTFSPNLEEKQDSSSSGPGESTSSVDVVERTVSQMSPIEEYFNTIKSGDLGRILGIPDATENSDLNLARALESQFEKTDPGTGRPMDEDPFDEFVPKDNTTGEDDLLSELLPAEADRETQENLSRTLPDLEGAEALPLAGQPRPERTEERKISGEVEEMVLPEQEDDPNDKTVKTILEGRLKVDTLRQEIPEPIKGVSPTEQKATHPSLASELAQEHEQRSHQKPQKEWWRFFFLTMGIVILLTGAYLNWTHAENNPVPAVVSAAKPKPQPAGQQTEKQLPSAAEAMSASAETAAVSAPVQDPLELAKEIVQNYPLNDGRGTVAQYLSRLYSKQLQDGYAAAWSAEPLHRDSYVVKYRLAKTRQEPIVYIFQADTAKKKLTGALNNITLDLVGKIS